jgi:hypothetical protein
VTAFVTTAKNGSVSAQIVDRYATGMLKDVLINFFDIFFF